MEPVVTLQHFTLPVWLADRGGVASEDAPRLFGRFAAVCAEVMGADVRWWITLNEPGVLAVFGYLYAEWPPLQPSMRGFLARAGRDGAHARGGVHRAARRRKRTWLGRQRLHRAPRAAAPAAQPALAGAPRRGGAAQRHLQPVVPARLHHRAVAAAGGTRPARCRDCAARSTTSASTSTARSGCASIRADRASSSRRTSCPTGLPLSAFGWTIDPDALRRAIETPLAGVPPAHPDHRERRRRRARRAAPAVHPRPPRGGVRRHRRRRRRPRLPALDRDGQLRVGRGLLEAVRPDGGRPRHAGTHGQAQRGGLRGDLRTRVVVSRTPQVGHQPNLGSLIHGAQA